jgi:UDP-N-acetylmuramoylalanine--D-glutamate ligase
VNEKKEIEYLNNICGYIAVCGQREVVYQSDGESILRNDVEFCNVSGLSLAGGHNYLNVCAALALVDQFSLDRDKVFAALQGFSGLPHRMEIVCHDARGRKWINDSKSTNVHSLRAALQSQTASVCLIAGGRGKDEDYHEIFEDYSDVIARLILFGEDAGVIAEQAAKIDDMIVVDTLQQAVEHVAEFPGDILFSPACASFDQYRDYEARGEDFRSLAKRVASC